PTWPAAPKTASPILLSWCVQQLASAPPRHDGRVPLIDFLNSCTHELPDTQAQPIAAWIDRAASHLGIQKTAPRLPTAPTPRSIALMVQIEKAKTNDGSYLLKAWLSGTNDLPTLRAGERPLSLDALRQEVRELCA